MHSARPDLRLLSLSTVTLPSAAGAEAEPRTAAGPLPARPVAPERFGFLDEAITEISPSSPTEVPTRELRGIGAPVRLRQFPD